MKYILLLLLFILFSCTSSFRDNENYLETKLKLKKHNIDIDSLSFYFEKIMINSQNIFFNPDNMIDFKENNYNFSIYLNDSYISQDYFLEMLNNISTKKYKLNSIRYFERYFDELELNQHEIQLVYMNDYISYNITKYKWYRIEMIIKDGNVEIFNITANKSLDESQF